MKPTLAAEELRKSVTQYLSTTFALAEPPVREALERFLTHPEQGIFRGPYLRIRMPFRAADDAWHEAVQWAPDNLVPHRHQAQAWQRLSSLDKQPAPTLITTGTGSGKTESFLIPILDHCRRQRAQGRPGVKAILLYPMNALATDQAKRIEDYLHQTGMEQVIAGLYIGDVPEIRYHKVLTDRSEIRRNPPDVLITNYKMLDLLLQRSDDLPLWQDARITYVVLDEFHTYDGAQATDVAMLLRRLAAATGHVLGDICPVATSATLGEGGDGTKLRTVAGRVFGVPFGAGSVITEDRVTVTEFMDKLDMSLPLPTPDDLIGCGDPLNYEPAIDQLAAMVTGRNGLQRDALRKVLRQHILTHAVLEILGDRPLTFTEILEILPMRGAYTWGAAIRDNPRRAATALARYIALLSAAWEKRDDPETNAPQLMIETHVWVRAVSRLLRMVDRGPAFAWVGELPVIDADTMMNPLGKRLLPAVYCRHCGRSGWAAFSPERDPAELITDPDKIYRSAVGSEKKRVRPLIRATVQEVDAGVRGLLILDGDRVRPFDPAEAYGDQVVAVLANLDTSKEANRRAEQDRCPACDMDEGIRFLGAGLASLAAVVVTQLFAGRQLEPEQRKTLLFSDSVQDAAHRAGFVANRSYAFALRRLITSRLDPETPILLNDLIGDLAAAAVEEKALPTVVPPDLHDRSEVDAILAEETTGTAHTWNLIGERLAFQTILEFGLRSRQGRTLELTGTAAAEVVLDDPALVADLARDAHQLVFGQIEPVSSQRYAVFVRGLLERMRYRGAIKHEWLGGWIATAGTTRFRTIWGRRPDGMPAFPRGLGAPAFVLDRAKKRSEFDRIDADQGWLQDWAARCLGLARGQSGDYLSRFLPMLATEGVIAKRVTTDGVTQAYGLQPGHIRVHFLTEDQVQGAGIGCDRCSWQQTVHPNLFDDWYGQPCPRYRCGGALTVRDKLDKNDYYRLLYLGGESLRVVTAEHSGSLSRRQREDTERRFRDSNRYNDPNVLSCTPTLELGIDIGTLSAVILASLPPGPANYVQRAGRAGRRDGNAFIVTLVGRSPRDLYFLNEPREVIAGEILPPGSYLSAVELLRRQYVAHLVDLAARDRLPGVLPLPRRASALFGDTGWLSGFVPVALESAAVEPFLILFGAEVTTEAADELRAFAISGLADMVQGAEQVWGNRLVDLRARLTLIDDARTALPDDSDNTIIKRSLAAERRAITARISEIGSRSAQGALVELGLLPNYSLVDAATTLEATITWEETSPQGDTTYHSEVREYRRPGWPALTELAPGNTFYMRGYQHEVSGLDIGTESRPAWEHWRICPDCGYVRTTQAITDTTPCPRCQARDIGEVSALRRVLRPTRVTAHDRRDDVRIRDDQDDRRRRYYETVTAVDIEPADIEPGSWRHAKAVFGVDFTRRAVIRAFNLGTARYDRPAADRVAGVDVRISPFHVCPACGSATVDAPPASTRTDSLVAPSIWDPARAHHRPWCPHRRSVHDATYLNLILAHELRTEALRILLPVATLLAQERTASFHAALMAGVARKYGGDPAHLAVVTATMPDHETGQRRQFLVLYDTLPGGTGYLHRLARAEGPDGEHADERDDGFRGVLETARKVVAECSCQDDPARRACHRCLLSHVPGSMYDVVSRSEALDMLNELLDDWAVTEVPDTSEISLWDQVESELEARFLGYLEAWARRPDTPGILARGEVVNGRKTADLRIEGPDGIVRHWNMQLQNTIRGTRPDVVFRRVGDQAQEVSVYLDGYEWHASAATNRLASDAHKRARLRAHRGLVFQLTWTDLAEWKQREFRPGSAKEPLFVPYNGDAQNTARDIYQRAGRDPDELVSTMWTNPVDTLLAYLADPDPRRWLARAEAVTAGVLRIATRKSTSGSDGVADRVLAALRGTPLPKSVGGKVTVCAAGSLAIILDQRSGPAWSGFAVIDDRTTTIGSDAETHRRRWAEWLYWGNLLQFLDAGLGDSAQLALSTLDEFAVDQIAAAGGDGFLSALSATALDPDLVDASLPAHVALPDATLQPAAPTRTLSVAWAKVFDDDLLDPDEPGLLALARALADLDAALPDIGYELSAQAWQAEMAWPAAKVAVVLAAAEAEAQQRDEAFAAAGWDVRPVSGWTVQELTDRIGERG